MEEIKNFELKKMGMHLIVIGMKAVGCIGPDEQQKLLHEFSQLFLGDEQEKVLEGMVKDLFMGMLMSGNVGDVMDAMKEVLENGKPNIKRN